MLVTQPTCPEYEYWTWIITVQTFFVLYPAGTTNSLFATTYDAVHLPMRGPGSSVSISTGYGLDGPRIESRWGARFSAPVQTDPRPNPASCTMGTGSFPGVKSGRGMTLTPHPLLKPWSRKSRAIRLLPLWVVRPVQSLSACTRVHFTLLYPSPPSSAVVKKE